MCTCTVTEITPHVSGWSAEQGWMNAVFRVGVSGLSTVGWAGEYVCFYVSPGEMKCCGFAGLSSVQSLRTLDKEDLTEIFVFLKKCFGLTNKRDGRITSYMHNQLFYTEKDGVLEQDYPTFMEIFNIKKEMTWQSASEPHHRTALYSINFV